MDFIYTLVSAVPEFMLVMLFAAGLLWALLWLALPLILLSINKKLRERLAKLEEIIEASAKHNAKTNAQQVELLKRINTNLGWSIDLQGKQQDVLQAIHKDGIATYDHVL